MSQVVVTIYRLGRITLATGINSNDTVLRGEILKLILENLARESQSGNENQRLAFAFF